MVCVQISRLFVRLLSSVILINSVKSSNYSFTDVQLTDFCVVLFQKRSIPFLISVNNFLYKENILSIAHLCRRAIVTSEDYVPYGQFMIRRCVLP
jgi:hypothetical protein